MQDSADERRANPRHRIELAVVVTGNTEREELHGITRDISAGGVFFYTDSWPAEVQKLELRVLLPPEVTETTMARAVCTGRVIRVEQTGLHGKTGVAAVIDRFSLA